MRNQPFTNLFAADEVDAGQLIDPPAVVRFRVLGSMFAVGAIIVLARIAWVQSTLQGRFLTALNATTVDYELIPARDGRILSENSEVFAADVNQYSVQLHYRWLQQPIDELWLKRRMQKQLSRTERSSEETVESFRTDLTIQRSDMWARVATVCNLMPEDLAIRRQAIQANVTRIADAVNRRHSNDAPQPSSADADGMLIRVATAIRNALTTPPRRKVEERIVVREEESWHPVMTNVSLAVAGKIRENSHLFPGVRVVAGSRRTYPLDDVASHIIGARTPAKDTELSNLSESEIDSSWRPAIGRMGIELTYDHQLRGVPGRRRLVRNRKMEIVDSKVERNPVSGRDLVLTLNPSLQQHAETLLAEALLEEPSRLLTQHADSDDASRAPTSIPTGGSVVVMNCATGRIVAAASAPTFGLSLYTGASQREWDQIRADQRHPFLSRVTQTALPPGSIMKPITAAAALETGSLNPDDPFFCQGYLSRPDEHRCLIFRHYGTGHNEITLKRAIAESCNVYFFSAAQQTGFTALRQWCDRFGLGATTGVDLPFEVAGSLPGSQIAKPDDERHFAREVLGLAIGQSRVTVTPLQVARAYAAIANGGWLVTPHIVSPDGTPRTTSDIDDRPRDLTRRKISGLSERTLDRIRAGLTAVVQQANGTGYRRVRLDEITIAGKTGTAETQPGKPDHAWFAGYVPASAPQYAVVVALEHGGSGSRAAGPVAREIIRKMVALDLVP